MAHLFTYNKTVELESGASLPGLQLAYTTHGQLNKKKDNAVWIFHALTANSDPTEWWPGLVGEGKIIDPARYFIICANIPGSCYGSTGPLDIDTATGEPYYHQFPYFTMRDMVKVYRQLRDHLGIQKIHIGIGGSMGGQQLLEWAIEEPAAFEYIVPISTNAHHSPWAIAFNASQRHCIETDPTWKEKTPAAGINGMKVARGVALLSYRHYETYHRDQSETTPDKTELFKSESYQQYQGEKLARRFNAFSYYFLSKSMDSHNVGRGRGDVKSALKKIKAKSLIIGITTDMLFPLREQQFIADHIPGADFKAIHSPYGHDGFLLENEKIEALLQEFLFKSGYTSNTQKLASSFYLFL